MPGRPFPLRIGTLAILSASVVLVACAAVPTQVPHPARPEPVAVATVKPRIVAAAALPTVASTPPAPVLRPRPERPEPGGGVDGPGLRPPPDPASLSDVEPLAEPTRLGRSSKSPEVLLGQSQGTITEDRAATERGLASWYGRKFQGRRTASGEPYDMYAMTAAHPTLPLPSFARVRNPANGNEVVVRINDRGPFHRGRAIDLSYTAAQKLDLLNGVSTVEIQRITPEEIRTGSWRRNGPASAPDPADAAVDFQLAQRRPAPPVVLALAIPVRPVMLTPAGIEAAAGAALLRAKAVKGATPIIASAPAATDNGVAQSNGAGAAALAGRVVATAATAATSTAAFPAAAFTTVVASTPALPTGAPSPAPLWRAPVAIVAAGSGDATATGTVVGVASLPASLVSVGPALSRSLGAAGFWVQLGAFRMRDGAENFQRRVVTDLAWIGPVLSVLSETELHRLLAGPYLSRDEAYGVAQRVREVLNLVPMVVERQ